MQSKNTHRKPWYRARNIVLAILFLLVIVPASILAAAVRRPELAGARRLEAWFSPRPGWWYERLPALGLTPEPEPNDLAMMALLDSGEDPVAELADLYYTMGDGDLF